MHSVTIQEYVEALIEPVSDRIRAGDVTLREYIERILTEHVSQVSRALDDADRLNQERIRGIRRMSDERWARLEEKIAAMGAVAAESVAQLRRERELVTHAQTDAIDKAQGAVRLAMEKAEVATDKRFDAVNELAAHQGALLSQFIPREVAEAQNAELRRAIAELTEKLSRLA